MGAQWVGAGIGSPLQASRQAPSRSRTATTGVPLPWTSTRNACSSLGAVSMGNQRFSLPRS